MTDPAIPPRRKPSLTIREATSADTPLLAEIHTQSRTATYRGILSDEYLDRTMTAESLPLWEAKAAALAAGGGRAFIAESEGEPLAFVCVLAPDGERSAYIDNLHAWPERKGTGAGTALLEAAARWARAHGATRLHLRVIDRNAAAIGFYEARGWRCVEHLNGVMGGTPIQALVYALDLDPGPPPG